MKRRWLSAMTLFVLACLLAHGCLFHPRVAAQGTLAGFALGGPVDSEVARNFLEGRALPTELERLRAQYAATGSLPTREELQALATRYSPDVATLAFIEAVDRVPENQALRTRFEEELALVRRAGIEATRPAVPDDLLVLFVPGWFYLAHGEETGADLRRQRAVLDQLGVAHALVPIGENDTVEANARVVADAIRRASADHRLILVSASKGGGEVALALGRELRPEETGAVLAWLSIGGVVRGTPFADRALEPDLCWLARFQLGLEGFDLEGARSVQTVSSREAFDALVFPSHVRIVSYVASPLSGHVSDLGAFGYQRLRAFGPNDGITLLRDELIPGGEVLLAPGVDHFFQHPDQELWTAALFRVLVEGTTAETLRSAAG